MREKNKTLKGGAVRALRTGIALAVLFLCTFGCAFAAEGDAGANTGGGTDSVKLITFLLVWRVFVSSCEFPLGVGST